MDHGFAGLEGAQFRALAVPVRTRLRTEDAFACGFQLQPAPTAATVRCWDGGDVMVSPGSGAAGGEKLTACFVVDCPDADAAIKVATIIPAAWYGSVEVRPVVAEPR